MVTKDLITRYEMYPEGRSKLKYNKVYNIYEYTNYLIKYELFSELFEIDAEHY